MRYAIVSDIHANLQAWNAVLLDIRSMSVDKIICLGDIVGYGPNPRQALEAAYTSVDFFVIGNHDAAACNMLDTSLFNQTARELITWTGARIGKAAERFFRQMPLSLQGEGFRCTHGEFSEPGCFNYIVEPSEAMPSWNTVPEKLLFVGHTHLPGIFLLGPSGVPHWVKPQDFELEEDKRYIVNVGSVGQPRDDDARASYCIFDLDAAAILWRRIPFDLDVYREALAQAGLDPATSPFLDFDPRKAKEPVRTGLDFRPKDAPDSEMRHAITVQNVEELHGRLRRWRRVFAGMLAVLAVLGAALFLGWQLFVPHAGRVPGRRMRAVRAQTHGIDENLLQMPQREVAEGRSIPYWDVWLGDGRRQAVACALEDDGAPAFVLSSRSAARELRVSCAAIAVTSDMRLCLAATFKKSEDFAGSIGVRVAVAGQAADGAEAALLRNIHKEPTLKRKGGWYVAKQTFDLPAGAESVRFELHGRFAGSVRVKDVSLVRRQ